MPKRKPQSDVEQGGSDQVEELSSDELTFSEDSLDDDQGFSISEEEDEDEDDDDDDVDSDRVA